MNYSPIIGLEIHAELATKSKLFCRCLNTSSDLSTRPNTAICPVCVGLPGALPVLNRTAVVSLIRLGRTLHCTISESTKWDRKNYFYPDLPKGYQISQYDEPICHGGVISWMTAGQNKKSVDLTRIHLEEDTGKLTHSEGYSLIDYNRSSIPLVELVTEPIIQSAQEAKLCAREYQHVLRDLGIAEANMEKGQMRCEANVSVVPTESASDPAKRLSGTKVEIKNLNSFRSLERAINYEIERQSNIITEGGTITQQTRGWNEIKGETYIMREKETAEDYRYFPEPDLGRLDLTELAQGNHDSDTRNVWDEMVDLGVQSSWIRIVREDPRRANFIKQLREKNISNELYVTAVSFVGMEPKLADFDLDEALYFLGKYADTSLPPSVAKRALNQASPGTLKKQVDTIIDSLQVAGLDRVITETLNHNINTVERYRSGELQLLGFLVGQVRKALGAKGDPVAIRQELERQLEDKL